MAGKYAGIIDKLPRSFNTDPDYQEKVNAIKQQILQPAPDSSTPEDRKELSSDAIEEFVLEITAMQQVLNDNMIRSLGGALHASKLARIFRDLRVIKKMFDEQEKVLNILLDAYGQLLVDQYEVEGTSSLKLDDGASVRVQYEPHATVVDREANRKWAIANGLENLLSLPWQTVNALTKESLLKGEPEPDGVSATSYPKVVYTKG
jgi:hypothetical protein